MKDSGEKETSVGRHSKRGGQVLILRGLKKAGGQEEKPQRLGWGDIALKTRRGVS